MLADTTNILMGMARGSIWFAVLREQPLIVFQSGSILKLLHRCHAAVEVPYRVAGHRQHDDQLKDQIPVGFVVLKAGVDRAVEEVEAECVGLVRKKIGAVAALKTVMHVKRLPKTRSGKILRATIRKIADGEAWKMPATIDDPAILDEITAAMAERKVGVLGG
jgi:hypothetical protein